MTEARCRHCGIPLALVYHRDFAVMRVERRSAEEAATDLASRLRDAVSDAIDPLLREAVRAMLADAHAFLDGGEVRSPRAVRTRIAYTLQPSEEFDRCFEVRAR